MQIYSFGNWRDLLFGVVGWVISGILIIGMAMIALWALRRMVGETSFPALTLLVAIVGAVTVVVQTRSTANQQQAERARGLAFANGLARDAIRVLSRPLPANHIGEIKDGFLLPPELATERLFTLQQMAKAAEQLDLSKLPSAVSMAGVVKLRAALALATARMQARMSDEASVDMSDSVGDLILITEEIGQERDRLFPIYKLGEALIQSGVERR